MPNYWNPNNFYPTTYSGANIPQQSMPMQSMMQQPVNTTKFMEWVEGEVGAKAFQMPPGLPVNQPIALWDNSDTVIYLKSWGPMGIPNPIQKLRYEMPEQQNAMNLQSGAASPSYVTKEDLETFKNEIKALFNQNGNNSSGGNQNQNRGR